MTKRSTKTSRREDGFTLAEVLVAAVAAAVVAAAAAAALWQGFRVHAAVAADRTAEDDLARLALLEALRADAACAAPLAGVPFAGGERGFSAARLRAAPGAAPGPASVVRFSWEPSPDGRAMLRRETAPDADLSLARPVPYPAPDGAPRFSYAAPVSGPDGTNGPSAAAWSREWTDPDAFPGFVRAVSGATGTVFAVFTAVPRPDR